MKLSCAAIGVLALTACTKDTPTVPDGGPSDAQLTDASGADAQDTRADAGPPLDWPGTQTPATRTEGTLTIETVFVEGPAPEANPVTGDRTPTELNGVQVTRYRLTDEGDPSTIVIGMPGYPGGAASLALLGHAFVVRGNAAGLHTQFWAIDRRSNGLEDLRGLAAAEAASNAEIANGYYFGTDTIDGTAFAGFHAQDELGYMSEWGLQTHFEDLRRVIERIPEGSRRASVFLLGHSFGAAMSELFAAWEFSDGVRGADLIAGIVLIDNVVTQPAITEEQYLEGPPSSGSVLSPPGLDAIRSSKRYSTLPALGVSIFPRAEIIAMRAWLAPEVIHVDRGRDNVLKLLLGLSRVPRMTNKAIFGFTFDDHSDFLSIVCSSIGEGTGGELAPYTSLLGTMLVHPSDPDAVYTWIDAEDLDPPEWTDIDLYARSWTQGPSNFPEWYFPNRLLLDLAAAGRGNVDPKGWQTDYGLRAWRGNDIDVPVLAVPTEITAPADLEPLRARLAPIGKGRPFAGTTRESEDAFRVVSVPSMTHLDPVTAADRDDNAVVSSLVEFVDAHGADARFAPEWP